ncbi:MAG: D-alanyl-D-alanine carboxypeptidase [Clostridia bacterium]|nr:D-alanyl-D-alanine carboxypeptidase [Clostridia bacterium]
MKIRKIVIWFLIFLFTYNYIVFADDIENEVVSDFPSFIEASTDVTSEPKINSRAAIVFDRNSGSILFGKNENEQRKMASTTKIMTAIVVIENANLDDTVTVSQKSAGTGGSRLGLHTNDKITVRSLLYGLMLCSGNDAAVALAEHVGGNLSGFAELMNKKCNELNLKCTHFVTPHGLDNDDHYTTAYELAIIADYALKNDTFRNIVGTKTCSVTINNYSKSLSNTNELLGNLNGVYGVKTGFTNGANRCLVTSIKRGDMDLICVVLGADTKKDRTKDSIALIEYAFKNFELVNVKEKVQKEFDNWKLCNLSTFNVKKGLSNSVDVYLDDLSYNFLPINSNLLNSFSIYIYCDNNFEAPLPADSVIGYLTVSVDNKTIITLNIKTVNTIEKKNYTDFMNSIFSNYIYYLESIFFH